MKSREDWKNAAAVSLVVLASFLAPLAAIAVWLDEQVQDTDRYVETVAPLSYDDAVAGAVSARLTDELFQAVNTEGYIRRVLPEDAAFLAQPLNSRLYDFVRENIEEAVKSDFFNRVWVEANRTSHAAVLSFLLGEGAPIDENGVYLDLAPVVTSVEGRLAAAGVGIFADAPGDAVDLRLTIVASRLPAELQRSLKALDRLARVLPPLVIAAWAGAIALAGDRRRMLIAAGGGLALSMAAMVLTLTAGRDHLLESVAAGGGSTDAAAAIYDTLLRYPLAFTRWSFLAGIAVALVAWLAGAGRLKTMARVAGIHLAGASPSGGTMATVASWIDRRRRLLEAAAAFVVLGVLVWTDWPSLADVLLLGLVLAAWVALVEWLARLGGAANEAEPPRK